MIVTPQKPQISGDSFLRIPDYEAAEGCQRGGEGTDKVERRGGVPLDAAVPVQGSCHGRRGGHPELCMQSCCPEGGRKLINPVTVLLLLACWVRGALNIPLV